MTSTTPRQKLYSLRTGLHPPRILIYLREKGIAESAVEVIEVGMTATGINTSLVAKNNPTDAAWLSRNAPTVPVLEITNPDGSKSYICDSIAIFTYLELVFPDPEYKVMSGVTPLDHARHTEILALLVEISSVLNMYTRHASKLFSRKGDQDTGAAKYLLSRTKKQMQLLEDRMVDGELFLVGDETRFADCVAYATFYYFINLFGLADLLDKYPNLAKWYAFFSTRKSVEGVQTWPDQVKAIAGELSVKW